MSFTQPVQRRSSTKLRSMRLIVRTYFLSHQDK